MCPLFTFLVSLDMHTLEDFGLGERCFLGGGEALLDRRDLRYLPRDRDRDELLPLLLLLPLLEDTDLLFDFDLTATFAAAGGDFRCAFGSDLAAAGFFRVLSLLEALLLREELPEELDWLEPEELDPELELLELLLPEEELPPPQRHGF